MECNASGYFDDFNRALGKWKVLLRREQGVQEERMVLVTGGAGFIGANFVLDWLEQSDEAVINLAVLTYAGKLENLAPTGGG